MSAPLGGCRPRFGGGLPSQPAPGQCPRLVGHEAAEAQCADECGVAKRVPTSVRRLDNANEVSWINRGAGRSASLSVSCQRDAGLVPLGMVLLRQAAFEVPDPPPPFVVTPREQDCRHDGGEPSCRCAEALDRNGELRSVLVFRLRPVAEVHRGADAANSEAPAVIDVPLEANDVEAYAVSHPDEPTSAVRREAALVRDYAQWLGQQGRAARRHRIRLPDGRSLYTDCFDESTGEVLEAKGSAARTFVRAGLGQILDYGRYVTHERRALLLPSLPAGDLIELLSTYGVAAVWQERTVFHRADPVATDAAS